jgi:hypothetical protein
MARGISGVTSTALHKRRSGRPLGSAALAFVVLSSERPGMSFAGANFFNTAREGTPKAVLSTALATDVKIIGSISKGIVGRLGASKLQCTGSFWCPPPISSFSKLST